MSLLDRTLGRVFHILGRPAGPYQYPLDRTNDRHFAEGWTGPLYVWDIDKTYLATEIHDLRGLLAVPFEFAIDKRNVVGTAALLRALRRGRTERGLTRANPIYFVSASPPQLRGVIQRKMLLDGVEFDGITFKDQWALVKRGEPSKLREQIGYKVSALLLNRRELPWGADETLFGDDSESDALIYALYGDICAGRLRDERIVKILLHHGVAEDDAGYIASLADGLPTREMVRGIYINLEVRKNPELFEGFSRRLVPCHDTFQAALRLYEDGAIDREGVLEVAEQLAVRSPDGTLLRPARDLFVRQSPSLLRSAADMVARQGVGLDTVAELWSELQARDLAPDYFVVDPSRIESHPRPNVPRDGWLTPERLRAGLT